MPLQASTYDVRKAREADVAGMVLNGAATRIQAAVRGWLARRRDSTHRLQGPARPGGPRPAWAGACLSQVQAAGP